MLRVVANDTFSAVLRGTQPQRAFATGLPGGLNTDDLKETVKENIKEAAQKVSSTMSGVVDKAKHVVEDAKHFVHDATDRIKYDQESYTQAIKDQANKAQETGDHAVDKAADMADRASSAAAAGNAKQVDAAIGATRELHNTLSGERGPSASRGAGADDASKLGQGLKSGDKLDYHTGGSGPLGQKGPHLARDPEGQQSSQT